jgi:predicted 3-demethylubiquinone-9 3-methyltransferase (glyoxalase superfamily)
MNTQGGDKFNNAISISVQVSGQAEVDRLWEAITKEGREMPCGWCADKWGVHWQIIPFEMGDWTGHSDPEIAQHAFSQMMKMKKIIIADLHK